MQKKKMPTKTQVTDRRYLALSIGLAEAKIDCSIGRTNDCLDLLVGDALDHWYWSRRTAS